MATAMTGSQAGGQPGALAAGARRRWRDDAILAALATWVIGGLYLDGWAHVHRPGLETFWTPWHGVLYSGFVAAAAFMASSALGWRRPGGAVPAGYGLGLAGVVVFLAGAVGDATWHTVLGVERGIAALLSPTHLLLFTGGALVLTVPLRSAWASGQQPARIRLGRFLPALWSLLLLVALVLFFFQYLGAFLTMAPALPEVRPGPGTLRGPLGTQAADPAVLRLAGTALGVASILVTNLILIGPLLLMLRRWRPPLGSATLLFTVPAVLVTGLREFQTAAILPGLLAGGLATDLLIRRLDPTPARPAAFRAVGALAPLLLWAGYLLAFQVAWGLAWRPELWVGVTAMAMLSGLAASLLAAPPPVPSRAWVPEDRQGPGDRAS